MTDFDVVSEFPEAAAVVLSDDSGSLLEWTGDIDGETAGAVHAFTRQALSQAGEMLGLGTFERATIVGAARACILAQHGDRVLAVYAAAGRPLGALEKKLDATLAR
jgi:predicted regulator of Ras-like GTPase activity (Roadblock/LC7/MglB family)